MILVYVRHAIAMEREDFATYCLENGIESDDEQRPLTHDGKRKMKKNAEGLVKAIQTFADSKAGRTKPILISSPLIRALDTAAIIAKAFGRTKPKADFVTPTLSPGRTPKEFRDFLYELLHRPAGRIMPNALIIAVGHEPQLSSSIGWWIIGKEKSRFPLKKGGATCLEIGQALLPGEARLIWALPPAALRSL